MRQILGGVCAEAHLVQAYCESLALPRNSDNSLLVIEYKVFKFQTQGKSNLELEIGMEWESDILRCNDR